MVNLKPIIPTESSSSTRFLNKIHAAQCRTRTSSSTLCTTSRIISSGWGSWQKLNWEKNDVGTTVVGTDRQLPTSNAGAKELGFGTLGGATLVIIKEIIEIKMESRRRNFWKRWWRARSRFEAMAGAGAGALVPGGSVWPFFEAGCSRHDLLSFIPFRVPIGLVVVVEDLFRYSMSFRSMIFLGSPSKA